MSLTSAIAIYFITWWVCLFAVLPWGVRNAHEAGESVAPGNEAGAPVHANLWRKVAINTVVASLVFALVYGQLTYRWIGFEDIPLLDQLPKV